MTAAQEHLPTENFDVAANAELRIEVGDKTCYITITSGEAEIFGAVLQSHRRIELPQSKLAIFTYGGCSVRLEGFPSEPAYVSDETPMHAYLNAAYIINNRRKAARDVRAGPVVAIVGPHDCGKTSVATILLNYAIRSGWNPLLVETDVRHGLIAVPGAISAVQVEMPVEPDEGLLVDAPVCLYYAHTDAAYNTELYKAQVSRMATLCQERDRAYQGKFSNLAAGTIVDTMGWVEGQGKEVQAHVCRAFAASVILVIGDDKLHSAMQATFQGSSDVEVVKLPKSGGTVQRGRDHHKHMRDVAIKQYFLGRGGEMAPALQQVTLSAMKLFKVPGSMVAGAGLLPASMAASVDPTRLTPVELTSEHVGSLLAVCYTDDASQLAVTNVAGFVWVQQVDTSDDSVTLMCPHGTAPPSSCYVVGSIRRNLDLLQA